MNDRLTPLSGMCSARFDPLRELFAAKLKSGEDLGASLALNIDGEMVVDLWGGWANEARTAPWTENTITCVVSTTKTMTALAALVLVDRGELDLDASVAKYWPDFERPKGDILVFTLDEPKYHLIFLEFRISPLTQARDASGMREPQSVPSPAGAACAKQDEPLDQRNVGLFRAISEMFDPAGIGHLVKKPGVPQVVALAVRLAVSDACRGAIVKVAA